MHALMHVLAPLPSELTMPQTSMLETAGLLVGVLAGVWGFVRWPFRGARDAFVFGALRDNADRHKLMIDGLYTSQLAERARHGHEIAELRAEVASNRGAMDGGFVQLSRTLERLNRTVEIATERLGEHGENIAHMRGQMDTWDGDERRHRIRPNRRRADRELPPAIPDDTE